MNRTDIAIRRKVTAVLLIFAMLLTMIPASAAYADASYGFQPEGADNTANSMQMLEPSNISLISSNGSCYVNQINGVIDGTKEEGIQFTFTMSAGMNNFNKDWFLEKNMPLIKIYDEKEEKVVAQYSDGNGDLKFLGSHLTEDINNHGTYKTDELYIGVEKGVLGTGDYVIVFGAGICGNNADKIFGQDIKFIFSVKAAPELDEMIEQTEAFLANVKISKTEPGCYPQEAVDEINFALATAKDYKGTEPDKASDALYEALKAFKDKKNFDIKGIAISGIHDTVYVGDAGKAVSEVSVDPDEEQYKKVKWSVVEEPKEEPSQEVTAGNLIVEELTGKWVAAYSGTCYLKATSVKNPSIIQYQKITITSEEGVIAVNLSDKDARVLSLIENSLSNSSMTVEEVTDVRVFTIGSGAVTADDLTYLNSLKALNTLDLSNALLQEVGDSAFKGHEALEKVILPDTVTSIGQRAFYNCKKLRKLDIPASVTNIGGGAFAGCTALDSMMIIHAVYPPVYATNAPVSGDAFDGAGSDPSSPVTTIQVPYGCAEDYKAKQGWRFFNIIEAPRHTLKVHFTASSSFMAAADDALQKEGISENQVTDLIVTSPEGVQLSRAEDINKGLQTHFLYATTIDLSGTEFEDNKCNANHFKNRISLKYIYLPDTTNNLGGTSFAGCKNLRKFTIPTAVTHIGNGAFSGCALLGDTIASDAVEPPEFDGTIFPDNITTILVPPESVQKYKTASGWSTYRDKIRSNIILSLNKTAVTLEAPSSYALKAIPWVYNGDADDVTVKWSSSNSSVAEVSASMGKSVTVTALKAGTAVITASDITGKVTASCTVTVKTLAAPKVKAASASYNSVKVTWSGVSGAKGYEVYRAAKKNGSYEKIKTLTASARSFTDTGRSTGTTYYYKVLAYKTVGTTNYRGAYSSIVSAAPVPAKVTGVKASRGGSKKIKVTWKRTSGASGYTVVRSTKKTSGYKTVKTIKSGSTVKYTTGTLKKGKRYYFKVRAYRTVKGKPIYGSDSSAVSYTAK